MYRNCQSIYIARGICILFTKFYTEPPTQKSPLSSSHDHPESYKTAFLPPHNLSPEIYLEHDRSSDVPDLLQLVR